MGNDAKCIFFQLTAILQNLHFDKPAAHRDLKSQNIWFDKNNNIRVIDFGFSKIFDSDDSCF
jgi:serine/threonine protein kinase